VETTVPFKPTQGRPVLCRQCFQAKRPAAAGSIPAAGATAELIASTTNAEMSQVSPEILAASAQASRA
jgi:hypothetical protein